MKRQVITIQEDMVIYAPHHGEVWMTAWEIAQLFYVSGITVRNTIKRVFKQGALKDFEASKYIKQENGYSADVYNLDMVLAVAFQVDTYQALLFRKWALGKIEPKEPSLVNREKCDNTMIIMMNGMMPRDFS